ncbi:hypothetical protein RI129_001654 [Pyrocoelia pectoralis]|uniref:Pyrroline-5-carboxylate reductase n=1 Tax=Pyrocoelia pectoralis TaxID=417401 RepID=A0AAN7VNP9_9COLE
MSVNSVKLHQKFGFIGGGNIARAICEGMVRKKLISFSQVYVSSATHTTLEYWKDQGAFTTTINGKVADEADVIFLAVKPHIIAEAIAQLLQTFTPDRAANKLFISVLAGTTLAAIENILQEVHGARVMRVMPNTPLLVGEGCSVYCPGQHATEYDINLVKTIFQVSGVCELVPESLISSVGALAGSGPAFIYLIIEALSDGGVKLGIPRKTSTMFAAQTVLGAAKMVLETGRHTGILKEEVTSPGGTTIAGIHELEKGRLRSTLMDALDAAAKRAGELGPKK